MHNSDYIFNQQNALFYIGLIVGVFFIAIGINWYYKQSQLPEWENKTTFKRCLYLIAPCLTIILAIFISLSTYNEKIKYQRIKKHGVETIGTTIKEIRQFKGEATIQYSFTANNKIYISAIGYVYGVQIIKDIKTSGGRYKVIYNKNDPNESVMDFESPQVIEY